MPNAQSWLIFKSTTRNTFNGSWTKHNLFENVCYFVKAPTSVNFTVGEINSVLIHGISITAAIHPNICSKQNVTGMQSQCAGGFSIATGFKFRTDIIHSVPFKWNANNKTTLSVAVQGKTQTCYEMRNRYQWFSYSLHYCSGGSLLGNPVNSYIWMFHMIWPR